MKLDIEGLKNKTIECLGAVKAIKAELEILEENEELKRRIKEVYKYIRTASKDDSNRDERSIRSSGWIILRDVPLMRMGHIANILSTGSVQGDLR